ncbi:MAG: hypothetical protein SH850_08785 [Planctomycetaceae bacterium]|nr:hypothetical protein [Planctomycetaceae bacterium]MDZ4736811.1 hypothetical protein [Rhodospirillaceae bacterium]
MNESIRRTEIEGLSTETKARFLPHGNLLEPCRLTVATTDGKRLKVDLRSVSVSTDLVNNEQFDAVTAVYARRPLEPGRFQEVVADMLATIRGLGGDPDERLLSMATRGDLPGYEGPGTRLPINGGKLALSKVLDLEIKFNPDPNRGWYYLMTFSVPPGLSPSDIQCDKERVIRWRAIDSIRLVLPAAFQIELMFSATDHRFDNFAFKGDESDFLKNFITKAYFGDRYRLTMRAEVKLDKDDKTITKLRSEPTFVLEELEAVTRAAETGFWRADPTWRREHRFDLNAWNKVCAAKGDFSVIGIKIDPTSVPDAEEYVRQERMWSDRISLGTAPARPE